MKNFKYLYIIGLLLLMFFSCAKEESIDVDANFKATVINDDYSVPVKVQINNTTTGADTYQWTFEGATVENSNKKDPPFVYYDTPGTYTIRLKASNRDGIEDEKSIEVKIDAAVSADFEWQQEGSAISPVSLQMVNLSLGGTNYEWSFEGGNPTASTEQNPKVVFTTPGKHKIRLTTTNGKETYSAEKNITVEPAMTVDFDSSVDFIDQDYQAPVLLHLNNKSTNATSYEWSVLGGDPSSSTATNPDINFANAGTYTIILTATNDKESKAIQKQVTIQPNNNLLSFSQIKLGVSSAHGSIGSFFSSTLGKVITKSEVNTSNGSKIDFAYFGLNSSFTYNQLVSPDQVQSTAFTAIPNAIHTKIINSQELVGNQLSASGFNAINLGNDFNSINVAESNTGKTPFNNSIIPRVVLFQTEDGRKGAVKINDFVSNGTESYILIDIKVQKTP